MQLFVKHSFNESGAVVANKDFVRNIKGYLSLKVSNLFCWSGCCRFIGNRQNKLKGNVAKWN